ncbi:MAG: DUF1800 domain-containing protein [Dokdonella sp.]
MGIESIGGMMSSRRNLLTGLATAIGRPSTVSMHRPGKDVLFDMSKAGEAPSAVPPDRIGWLNKTTYGFTTADDAAFNALPGANNDAKWTAWVAQQLSPTTISDSACDTRLAAAGYTTLGKTLQQLWSGHEQVTNNSFVRMLPINETEAATIVRALYSKRQLFERVANFWHDHFNVFGWDYDCGPVFVHYDRDVIRANALGNFRTLLEAVATSTAMQIYLDNKSSRGADFNENFAREMIELHTLGVENYFGPTDPFSVPCVNPSVLETEVICPGSFPAGYVDNDVYEAAASLTGWTIKDGYWQYPDDDDGTFLYRPDWHDRRNKIFNGLYIPPDNQPAMQDGRDVFDRLVAHPGTAKHIATKLCRRFVGDTPSAALVASVAQDFTTYISAPDQIKRMLQTILLSNEFKQTWGAGMKRPFEATMGALRAIGGNYTPQPDNTNNWTTSEEFSNYLQQTGHRPFYWGPPNGYPDRQGAWSSTGTLAMTMKTLARLPEFTVNRNVSNSPYLADILGQTQAAFPTASTRTAATIMGYWCDRIFGYRPEPAYGVATQFLRQNATASEAINIDADTWNGNSLKLHYSQQRLRSAVSLLFLNPDFLRR